MKSLIIKGKEFAAKCKGKCRLPKKGEVSVVAQLLLIGVLLVVTYPLYRNFIKDMFSLVQKWFENTYTSVFGTPSAN